MKPFFTTLLLTAAAAGYLWKHQHDSLAALRAELATTSSVKSAVHSTQDPKTTSAKPKPKPSPTATLRRADGTQIVTARSMVRGFLEAVDYFRHLSRSEVEAMLAAGIEDGDAIYEFNLMAMLRLAEFDPLAALALAQKKKDDSSFPLIMYDWLIRDRAAALKWFHAQPDSEKKASFMGVAGMVLGSSDPELLQQLSGSFEDPDMQDKALENSITALAMNDPKAALGRLHELPDDAARTDMLLQMITYNGEKMPRELLDAAMPLTAENGSTENKMLRGYSVTLLGQYAATDPRAALEWITSRSLEEMKQFQSGSPKRPGLMGIGKLEASEVLNAIKDLPPAQQDWLLASHYSGRPLGNASAVLTEASAAIKDPELRNMTILQYSSRVMEAGRPAELEPWLQSLPASEQAAMRAAISKQKP